MANVGSLSALFLWNYSTAQLRLTAKPGCVSRSPIDSALINTGQAARIICSLINKNINDCVLHLSDNLSFSVGRFIVMALTLSSSVVKQAQN